MKKVNELNMFMTGLILCLKNGLSIRHYFILKCFNYSRVKVFYILHGATITITPAINQGKVISSHLIGKKLPSFQVV